MVVETALDPSVWGPDVASKVLVAVLSAAIIAFSGWAWAQTKERVRGQRVRADEMEELRRTLRSIGEQTASIPTLADSMAVLLRTELVREYRKWVPLGHITLEGKEHVTDVYEQYHGSLGRNGVGTSMYEALMRLPIEEER